MRQVHIRSRLASPAVVAASLLLAAPLTAQVDFSAVAVEEFLTTAEIESALETAGAITVGAGTSLLDGIAVDASSPTGDIIVAHRDDTANQVLTFARFDASGALVDHVTAADLATDLGAPYTADGFQLTGELIFDAANDVLYFADNSQVNPPTTIGSALLVYDWSTGTAAEVLRDDAIGGWNSHGLLSSGEIVAALGEDLEVLTGGASEPQVGFVDPSAGTPAWEEVADADEFKTIAGLGPTEELPPETIAVDPADDTVYVFGHDNFRLFTVTDFLGTPSITQLAISEWNQTPGDTDGFVDLHGMSVDDEGNLIGFTEVQPGCLCEEGLVVWDGTSTFALPFDDAAFPTGEFSGVVWRGMKARSVSPTQTEVWLSSGNPATYGVVRVTFGSSGPTSVQGWSSYE